MTLKLPLYSTCGSKGICGTCRVIIENTDGLISPPSDREQEVLGELLQKGYRLACETILEGSAVVRIPEESHSKRQVILTSGNEHLFSVRLLPNVRKYYIEVREPTIDIPTADRERLLLELENAYHLKHPILDPLVLRKLPQALRSEKKGTTLSLWGKNEIVDVVPGQKNGLFGVASDIGTTTVVVYLIDLDKGQEISVQSSTNPQTSFGADVISRISFCQEQRDGLRKLCSAIVQCLNELVMQASSEAGIDPSQIMEMTAVGNTAMHHLFMGVDPRYLSQAPYPPVLQESQNVKARDLGIAIGHSAYVHLLPLKAGFVGSDMIACILATGIHRSNALSLLIDLGTNGEIVFGNKDGLICCSTAAGPAFEGGHIRWGMRAESGAIEKAEIDPQTLNVMVETIDNQRPVGLCGSGVISAIAEMVRAGIILSKGNFNDDIQSPRLREGKEGREFVLVWAKDTGIGQDIVLTQKDVSEIQMAKSAIYSGAV
ncbi:MAG: ASKHA domain-containing protein, partial [Deltaproteobacteria bacterium]